MSHSVKRRRQALHQTHHHYYLNISVEAANLSDWRIESKKNYSVARIESKLFCPNWNAVTHTHAWPPSTWLIQPKISKIFQGHFFEIFGVKVETLKEFFLSYKNFQRDFSGLCAYHYAKIRSLSSSNKLSREMHVFGLSRFLAHF